MQPEFIVCDEPVASLDVSIQAQVINLLLQLKRSLDLTLLFISHDLSVVRHLCDHVVVMHHGKIVERGTVSEVFAQPKQPYTQMLLNAVPKLTC
jgi:peptide/nickel transport system ATP-binding protein